MLIDNLIWCQNQHFPFHDQRLTQLPRQSTWKWWLIPKREFVNIKAFTLLWCTYNNLGNFSIWNQVWQELFREAPPKKKPCIFGNCPNYNLTPPNAQIRALCGTTILPKMRKFFRQQFWLWEWIFWQRLMSKMNTRAFDHSALRWGLHGSIFTARYCPSKQSPLP